MVVTISDAGNQISGERKDEKTDPPYDHEGGTLRRSVSVSRDGLFSFLQAFSYAKLLELSICLRGQFWYD